MGLSDRDYMRERYQQRAAASRVRDNATRPNRAYALSPAKHQGLIYALCLVAPAIGVFREAKREGWIPDTHQQIPFPPTGDVMVNRSVSARKATASFEVRTADANAVAQLYTEQGRHILSVFVGKNGGTVTHVPPGHYRLKIIEGQTWFGPERFFGNSMTHETAVTTLDFVKRGTTIIDLHRRPNGNLLTRPEWKNPSF